MKKLETRFFAWRAALMGYRYAALSGKEHCAVVERLYARLRERIENPREFPQLCARSAAQYLAQCAIRTRRSRIITECIAWVLTPTMLAWWVARGMVRPTPQPAARMRGVRWLKSRVRYDVTPELYHVPPELAADAPALAYTPARYMRLSDIVFLARVICHGLPALRGLHMQWIFKAAKEIAWLRPTIEHYPSDYALVEDECNAALSIATLYAHRFGQLVYSVQHGDLFISVYTSFFRTDRAYCWADFYVETLKTLRAASDFRLYPNPAFTASDAERAVAKQGIGVFQPNFHTLTTPEERTLFAHAIATLAETHAVAVRPHPAFFQEYEAMRDSYGPRVTLAPAHQESCKQFILRHRVVIGTTSAALLEALMLGTETISVRGRYTEDVATYHFAYRLPNCHFIAMDALVPVAEHLLNGGKVWPQLGEAEHVPAGEESA